MILSELTASIARKQTDLKAQDTTLAVKTLITLMRETLASGERIEVRGFGSFELRQYEARVARNPRTGEVVDLPERHRVYFKPGKELRQRVNAGMQ
ncbi:MAG: HU family DNA-binding protein [Lamprobacter sp.]|uniref:HU family DNA-binding protein n=1 Tax=Lamprobacter sp. TaxID=3100796 RepID=UPI002B256B29|nr:HU family DNA-binding protein [Lamprobacter sp.]MEA3638878.1 HU family DNA-binding protein [Lamprobacter sp.]